MNELGMTLAWLAVQVTLVVVPALVLHALATRRGPALGSWVAALSLGLVVALNLSALVVKPARERQALAPAEEPHATAPDDVGNPGRSPGDTLGVPGPDRSSPTVDLRRRLSRFRLAWARFERRAAEPASRCRPWGGILAVVALAGMGVGLLRLITGLWAVRVCRQSGEIVDDPELTDLLDELRGAMGCRLTVELRVVRDLTTPATAGWRRPVLLLPQDWRSWSGSERRAVLAHELAHILRGDYAAGLLARVAVLLNCFHPLVHWIAGRLRLQQEQAADALGAQFAGGRTTYLLALSRLALEQDGRSPCWPARAFLPGQGTLIRRIAMLRDQSGSGTSERPASGAWRLLTGFALVALTVGVATLRGPVHGAEDVGPATSTAKLLAPSSQADDLSLVHRYLRDGMDGLVLFRPSATIRRKGMDRVVPLLSAVLDLNLSEIATKYAIDPHRPGFPKLGWRELEWVACGVSFRRAHADKNAGGEPNNLLLGGLTVRTTAPFDWLAYLREWRFDLTAVREHGRVYYKMTGPLQPMLGPVPCLYLPDDRTIIFDEEKTIRTLLNRATPSVPGYLRGADWARASRGLLAVAIDNQGGKLAKRLTEGRPDGAWVQPIIQDADHWIFGIDDTDTIGLHAAVACRSVEASEPIARTIDSLRKQGQEALDHPDPEAPAAGEVEPLLHMARALLANLRIQRTDRSVELRAKGLGTLAEFASILAAQINGEKPRDQGGETKRSAPSGRADRHDP
jgi:beta-lactamase regulating signal transducer with metallopeptidase domain